MATRASISTSTVAWTCSIDGTTTNLAVSGLEAGSDANRDIVELALTCGHTIHTRRTWDNPLEIAAAINGLHAYLVSQAQINSNWTTELGAETAAQLPTYAYTPTGTPRDIYVSDITQARYAYDPNFALDRFNVRDLQKMVGSPGIILLKQDDSTVTAFANQLFSSAADKAAAADILKILRDREFIV